MRAPTAGRLVLAVVLRLVVADTGVAVGLLVTRRAARQVEPAVDTTDDATKDLTNSDVKNDRRNEKDDGDNGPLNELRTTLVIPETIKHVHGRYLQKVLIQT